MTPPSDRVSGMPLPRAKEIVYRPGEANGKVMRGAQTGDPVAAPRDRPATSSPIFEIVNGNVPLCE